MLKITNITSKENFEEKLLLVPSVVSWEEPKPYMKGGELTAYLTIAVMQNGRGLAVWGEIKQPSRR